MSENLYTKTMRLLRSDTRTINEISAGAGVNPHWLSKLRQGKFANPGVVTIERLHNYLAGIDTKQPKKRRAA